MKALINIALLILLSSSTYSQSSQMLSSEDNDPIATEILDRLSKEMGSYESMKVEFDMTIEIPEREKEIQKGSFLQQGDKYMMDLESQTIYNDGNYIWLHVKNNNEVQINDIETDEDETDILSPKDMMTVYESGDYAYAIADTPTIDGVTMTQIDFKPLDKDSEYFRISLTIDQSSNKIVQMKIFSKDGSRYMLKIDNIASNIDIDPGTFTFDESKFPGIHKEDLRID